MKTPPPPDGPEAVRLDRRVTQLLRCSRAQAQQYIEGGWVTVAGQVVETPQSRVTTEVVALDAAARLEVAQPASMLLHKPVGTTTHDAVTLVRSDTHSDTDASGVRLLQRHFHRLAAAMPLDSHSSGLLVVTQDHRVMRRLTEDAATIEQEYIVEVKGEPVANALAHMMRRQTTGTPRLPACKVSWQNETRLRIAIKAVQPGELQRMCAAAGLDPIAMRRIRIGRVSLGKTAPGSWRYQPSHERF